jgi:predicted dehydrogenase
MINIGVVGYGYWGPNIVRNFNASNNAQVICVCDKNSTVFNSLKQAYPSIHTTTDFNELITSTDIDAVAIVTPVSSHYEFSKLALRNGKHIFVEKPFTSTVAQAEELIELADKNNLKIMVDHTFLFTGAVNKMKELVEDGTLGDLYYFDSTRINLGPWRHGVNAIWDLAPHDLSIMDYILDEEPDSISANGKSHFNGFEDIAYITVNFRNNMIAHFNVNWLSPVKVRSTLIGGSKKMLVWNDLAVDEIIKVYDKGVDVVTKKGIYELLVSFRSGDMFSPKVVQTEALKVETEYFVDCILNDKTPFNDGHSGLKVIKMLEASDASLKNGGKMIQL